MSPSGCARPLGQGLILALLAGCGDGMVDGSYTGEPVFTLSGIVRYEADGTLPEGPLYVTVAWEPAEAGGYEYVPALEVETTFPARYAVSVYAPPPDAVLWPQGEGSMGIGAPLLYADLDGDALLDPAVDELVGGASDVYLLYLTARFVPPPAGRPTEEGEEPPSLEAGFHAVRAEGGCPGEGTPLFPLEADDVDLTVVGEDYDPLEGCRAP